MFLEHAVHVYHIVAELFFVVFKDSNGISAPAGDVESGGGNKERGCISKLRQLVSSLKNKKNHFMGLHQQKIRVLTLALIFLAYNIYFICAVTHHVTTDHPIDFCNGVGLLIIATVLAWLVMFYKYIFKRFLGDMLKIRVLEPLEGITERILAVR